MRRVARLCVALLSACGSTEPPTDPADVVATAPPKARGPIQPRTAYAECVVTLRGTTPDPADAGSAAYIEASTFEVHGDIDGAIGAYRDFVSANAGSKLVPRAYFALGILSAHQAESDPDRWIVAEQSFNSVLGYATDVDLVTYVELARVQNRRGKWPETLRTANKAADRARAAPNTPCAELAITQVSDYFIEAYVETGDPARAFSACRRLMGPLRIDEAAVLTERIARVYEKRGDAKAASDSRAGIGPK
ncbi:MAG: hypothetical protein U0414_20720 [Polyangiaceae bacterium]